MDMTLQLKQYLVDNHGLKNRATDDEAKSLLGELVATGKIDLAKVKELLAQGQADVKSQIATMIKTAIKDAVGDALKTGTKTQTLHGDLMETTDTIRVKSPSERYLQTKSLGKHIRSGEPVMHAGTPVYGPSQLELARIGAWFKHFLKNNMASAMSKVGLPVPTITEHDEQLLKEMWANGTWCGRTAEGAEVEGKSFDDLRLKAPLINDSTSGGQYLIPTDFDTQLITTPLLYAELLPLVDLRTTTRDTVEAGAISNPTVTWSTAEGSALTAFDATSLVTQVTENVYPVAVAIEVGRDFLADSPADVGATLMQGFGQVLSKELDDVIACGNGTTQPEGIFTGSAVNALNSDNGSTGPWTLGDIEALLFGIAKQYRTPSMGCAFVSNDTTYARWRGLALGTADARRLLGMDHESYSILSRPHRINGDIGNGQAGFVAMKKYRLWRRAGVEFYQESGGKTLTLANTVLLMARGRYAGCLVQGGAAALIEDGQS
jgi:HK97 family phage major capsid protein